MATSAQQRVKIADGISLVTYGNHSVIEDDNKQCSVSISIAQERIDHQNGQKLYRVACKGWTKTVAKGALKQAISMAITSAGFPTIAKYASTASGIIYDAACNHYNSKYE